jgi:predicted  nucleic acid-binding Zn-ribbon protein
MKALWLSLLFLSSISNAADEMKVQRPMSAGSAEELQSATEAQLKEWDAKIASLRDEMVAASDRSEKAALHEAIGNLEKAKREIRAELKDLIASEQIIQAAARKEIQKRFQEMGAEMEKLPVAE